MAKKFSQSIKRHVGYSEKRSPEYNVALGRSKGYSYLRIGRELNIIANLEHGTNPKGARVFRKSAQLAFRLHDENR